jgi:hypothetical protein
MNPAPKAESRGRESNVFMITLDEMALRLDVLGADDTLGEITWSST